MTFLHLFLEMMATERGATRSTLSAYGADLDNFYEFFKDQPIECVTFQNIQAYLLTQKHLSPSTVARRVSTLRQFYVFLVEKGKMKESPLFLVKTTRPQPKTAPFLRAEDVKRLLEGAKAGGGVEGKRLSALLQILHATDMSVDDLVSLPFAVGLFENLSNTALEALQEYLKVRNSFLAQEKASPWLFPSFSQKGHLTRQRFGQLMKELALKVGLDSKHISLRTIRQGFRNFN